MWCGPVGPWWAEGRFLSGRAVCQVVSVVLKGILACKYLLGLSVSSGEVEVDTH